MKSTNLDKAILNLLVENKEGLPLYVIARKVSRDASNINKKLKKLIMHNLITKIRSSITIYKLCESKRPTVYFEVKCPKCYTVSSADYNQLTKVCPNESCLTKTGKRTRYYIDIKRIVDKIVI